MLLWNNAQQQEPALVCLEVDDWKQIDAVFVGTVPVAEAVPRVACNACIT